MAVAGRLEPDLSVRIGGRGLPNPVGAASGTFGFGEEYAPLTNIAALGAVFTKAVTPEPRAGNPPPRLVETPSGLINAIGLANPGLEGFFREKVPILRALPCPAVVNIAGDCEADYVRVAEALDSCDPVWGAELNVSCPNVDCGGMAFGIDAAALANLVRSVRAVISKPLVVKLSPNVTDITSLARAAADAGADALSCVNTFTGMKIDINRRKPVIPRGTGGLSGPAVRPLALAAVWKTAKAVSIPVIGLGGIGSAEDALEFLLAGAAAVQVGTSIFSDPDLPERVLRGIREYMQREGFRRISDFHGFF